MSQTFDDFVVNALMSREALIRRMTDNTRDIDTECGYPTIVGKEDYWNMYRRNGIAKRVVKVFPEECWSRHPDVYEKVENEETEFEKEWKKLTIQHNVFSYLKRLDEVSGIGQYGVMLIGLNDGKELNTPVLEVGKDGTIQRSGNSSKPLAITFLRVFPESLVEVTEWEKDIKSPRYGQPVMYNIKFGNEDSNDTAQITDNLRDLKVHWSRIIHAADNRISSEVFGTPRMEPVFNYLLDIKKTLGGSAEMFYKGGFPGISFEMSPEVAAAMANMTPEEQEEIKEGMREEFRKYQEKLQRFLALIGVQAKSLAVQIAEPTQQFDCQITAICITLDIPKRIFMGSERGELASSQDSGHWNGRVRSRQTDYLEPFLLRPFIGHMILLGVLPKPEQIFCDWPERSVPGPLDAAKIASAMTEALSKYVTGDVAIVVPPLEFFTHVLGWDLHVAQAVVDAANTAMAENKKNDLIIRQKEPQEPKNGFGQSPASRSLSDRSASAKSGTGSA